MRVIQIVRSHRTEGRDAGSGGDEQGVLRRIAHGEEAERRAHFHRVARLHLEQVRREEAVLDQVEAQLESIAMRERGDGIGPNYLLAFDRHFERYELAGLEMQSRDLGHLEGVVADLRGDVVGFDQDGLHCLFDAAPAAWDARSSRAWSRAGWPSSGAVTAISMLPLRREASSARCGRSRCMCVPSVRK